MTGYDLFSRRMAQINDLCCVLNLFNWDAGTMMPDGGVELRGHQVATVASIAHEMFTDLKTLELIKAAEQEVAGEDADSYRVRAVMQAREAYEISQRVPVEVVGELNELKTVSQVVWAEARANNNFAAFAPYLQKVVDLNRKTAEAMGYEDHPYDALLSRYEPGLKSAQLKTLFAELRAGLDPILARAKAAPAPRIDFLTERDYPVDQQREFALEIAKKFGYDLKRGRLDETVHPFEISFTRNDVRITTRYHRNYMPAAVFGAFHESGHALYEQGADPVLTRTVLTTDLLDLYGVAGVSYGMHEAQSRLWENLVGRSRTFWENHYTRLQEYFPEQLGDIDLDTFYRAVNRVEPSYIRVEADEVTYNYHIMLRVEVEMGLIEGSLKVKDLPEVWKEKMLVGLGVTPPNDRLGVLQDIHWASGTIGAFPNYTLGNVMSAQFFAAAHQQVAGLDEALKKANYSPLLEWLTQNIYRHARAFMPYELLQRATGSPLNTGPYLGYLNKKYGELFPG